MRWNLPTKLTLALEVLVLAAILCFAYHVYEVNKKEIGPRRDIAVEFAAGINIKDGQNPYSTIKEYDYDIVRNRKYNAMFPLYYLLLATIAFLSNWDFNTYISAFRYLIYTGAFISGLTIYFMFREKGYKLLGLAAAAFWLLNRWTIQNFRDVKQDSIAILFLILALYFFRKKLWASFLFYGISLGIKHIGIFVAPIYLIPLINREKSIKEYIKDAVWVLIPTLGPALVFLLDDAKSFIYSIVFSLTRAPSSTNTSVPWGYDKILIKFNPTGIGFLTPLYYILPRALLLGFSLCNVILMLTKKIKVSFYVFVAMLLFATFNPVVLDQYVTWITPFFFLSVLDYIDPQN